MAKSVTQKRIDPCDLIEDVLRVILEAGGDISSSTYRARGKYSSTTVVRYFGGSWLNVLERIGITKEMASQIKKQRSSIMLTSIGDAKRRVCLGCDREFWSNWKGNRVCGHCRDRETWKEPVETYTLQLPSAIQDTITD